MSVFRRFPDYDPAGRERVQMTQMRSCQLAARSPRWTGIGISSMLRDPMERDMIDLQNRIRKMQLAAQMVVTCILLSALPQAASSQDAARLGVSPENPLDGLQFIAGIVREGDEEASGRPLEDRLIFKDGQLSSVV